MSLSVSGGSREQSLCLYLSQVGLVSSRLHGTFTAVPSQSAAGTLALVRRCQPVTCEGHCTCAPHGQLTCTSTKACTDVKGVFRFRGGEREVEGYGFSCSLRIRE